MKSEVVGEEGECKRGMEKKQRRLAGKDKIYAEKGEYKEAEDFYEVGKN